MAFATTDEIGALFTMLQNPRCRKALDAGDIQHIQRGAIERQWYETYYLPKLKRCSPAPFDSDENVIQAYIPNFPRQSNVVLVNPKTCGSLKQMTNARPGKNSLFECIACALHFQGQVGKEEVGKLATSLRLQAAEYLLERSAKSSTAGDVSIQVSKAPEAYRRQFTKYTGSMRNGLDWKAYAMTMRDGEGYGSLPEIWALSQLQRITIHVYEKSGKRYVRKEKFQAPGPLFARLVRLKDILTQGDRYVLLLKSWERPIIAPGGSSTVQNALKLLRGPNVIANRLTLKNGNGNRNASRSERNGPSLRNNNNRNKNANKTEGAGPLASASEDYVDVLMSRIALSAPGNNYD